MWLTILFPSSFFSVSSAYPSPTPVFDFSSLSPSLVFLYSVISVFLPFLLYFSHFPLPSHHPSDFSFSFVNFYLKLFPRPISGSSHLFSSFRPRLLYFYNVFFPFLIILLTFLPSILFLSFPSFSLALFVSACDVCKLEESPPRPRPQSQANVTSLGRSNGPA